MKTCPVCKRTFEDNLTFCLMDGTVLSAPDDEDETPSVTAPRITVPAPTAILNPTTKPGGPRPPHISTIVSPQPLPLYSPKQPAQANEGRSRKPWLALGIAAFVGLILIAGTIMAFIWFGDDDAPPRNTNTNVNANVTSSTDCFAGDPRAGSINRATHYSWAKDQTVGRLQGNLNFKLDLLFQCESMNAQRLAERYADVSVVIAGYVPDANCFGGDAGVVNNNASDHKAWGLNQGANGMRENLEWKTGAALKCLVGSRQASFFADVSVALAGGGDTVNDESNSNVNSNSNANTNVRPPVTPTPTPRVERWGPTNESASLKGERLTYYPGTTAAQCKADCDRNPGCTAFTLIRAGTYNPSDPPMCYLMSVATEMVPHACCISAIKR